MNITVEWDNDDHNTLRYTFIGPWNNRALEAVLEQGFGLMESESDKIVHVIFDMRRTQSIADGFLIKARQMFRFAPHNHGLIVVVGGTASIKAALEMFRSINKRYMHQFVEANSLLQARKILRGKLAKLVSLAS